MSFPHPLSWCKLQRESTNIYIILIKQLLGQFVSGIKYRLKKELEIKENKKIKAINILFPFLLSH
jgi:hypothetical protein